MILSVVFAAFRSLKAPFIVILHSEKKKKKVLLLSSTDEKKKEVIPVFHFWVNYSFNEILLLPHSLFFNIERI